ncbi:TIGR03757 family integrating conjugative element protein [Salmonella enterica subsp. enterica serovar Eastbourne]|nr:TIGR03757 family integrating conjugative element protein [Salmonella enterica subsp. enterica serovar Eastbourne]EHC5910055.1 TIGR03757 family integrating conjugative element protein [Salmonella enterica subsp. enterica serovar Eastbourne]
MNLSLFILAAFLEFIVGPAFATDIHIFTDYAHPVHSVPQGITVVELDAAERLENELSTDLPADPDQAAHLVQRRLEQGGKALQHQLATAYQGVTEAWTLGVAKIPAIVMDRHYAFQAASDTGMLKPRTLKYSVGRGNTSLIDASARNTSATVSACQSSIIREV